MFKKKPKNKLARLTLTLEDLEMLKGKLKKSIDDLDFDDMMTYKNDDASSIIIELVLEPSNVDGYHFRVINKEPVAYNVEYTGGFYEEY